MSDVLVSNDYIYTYVHYILNSVHSSTYSNCTDGQVRLFGGSTDYEGTVEICINNAWGTISDYRWGYQEAQTVCNVLGYTAPGMNVREYLIIKYHPLKVLKVIIMLTLVKEMVQFFYIMCIVQLLCLHY